MDRWAAPRRRRDLGPDRPPRAPHRRETARWCTASCRCPGGGQRPRPERDCRSQPRVPCPSSDHRSRRPFVQGAKVPPALCREGSNRAPKDTLGTDGGPLAGISTRNVPADRLPGHPPAPQHLREGPMALEPVKATVGHLAHGSSPAGTRPADYRPERPAKTPSSATDSGVEPDSAMSRSLAGDGHAHQIPLGKVSGGSPASHSDVRSSGSRARVWPTWITASNCSPRRASK